MKRVITVFLGAMALNACTWVDLNTEAEQVSVITGPLPGSCLKTGSTTVSVVDKVVLGRSPEKVAKELETMARNRAVGRGDALKASSEIVDGEQSFDIYRCAAEVVDESFIYVTNEDSNNLSVISSVSNTVVATIPVGKRPRGIKVSPDGSTIYVALSGSPKCPPTMPDEECDELVTDKSADGIAEVDARTRKVVRILPSGSDPEQFDINWQTGRLYVSNEDANQTSVLDLHKGEIILTAPTGMEPEGVRLSPDGMIFYVTGEVDSDVTVLDAQSGEVLSTIKVGLRPRDIVFMPDGSRAFVSAEFGTNIAVIDVANNRLISEIALPEGAKPMGLVLSPDNSTLYVANGRGKTVVAIDLASEKVIASVEVGPRPWGLSMSLDKRFLYSANGPSDDVSVIDIESFTVITKVPVGETPWGMDIGPMPAQ